MGFLLATISALLATSKDLVSKNLSFSIDGTTSTFASFAYAIPFYLLLMAICHVLGFSVLDVGTNFLWLVLLRSLSDMGAEWTKMQALETGDISYVMPLVSLSPLFLLFFSPLITGDELSTIGVIGVLLSVLGGLLLVGRKGLSVGNKKATLLALACAFFFALNTCFDRLTVQTASPVLSGFAMTLLAGAFFAPAVLLQEKRRAQLKGDSKPLFIRGFLEVAFMVTKLSALQYLQAPYVAAIGRLTLLFSIIGGRVLFKEEDFTRRVIAGVVIAFGAVLVVFA